MTHEASEIAVEECMECTICISEVEIHILGAPHVAIIIVIRPTAHTILFGNKEMGWCAYAPKLIRTGIYHRGTASSPQNTPGSFLASDHRAKQTYIIPSI